VSRLLTPILAVDTNIVSYVFKRDTRAELYRPFLVGRRPMISFMTVAELEQWTQARKWGARRRQQLQRQLSGYAVHWPDPDCCRIWGQVMTEARATGRAISPNDAWIATTALFFNIPLLTHDPDDYAGVPGLTVLSATGR
jgi:predicted nucleic acid-binding protein